MNKIPSAAMIIVMALLSNCGDDPVAETEMQRVQKLLIGNGSWNLQDVAVDGVDQTKVYAGLSLTFTASQYTSTNGRDVWPSSDTWNFVDNTAQSFKRSDGLIVSIDQIDQSILIAEFNWATNSFHGGKTNALSGNHKFRFKK